MPKRIVVVDDDKEVREIVTFALACNGFEITALWNGQQLQQALSTMSPLPDLLMLDVMMPGEDGYQLCSNVRNDPRTKHIPIMIMTAHAEAIYQRISVDLGAALHVTKPFHPLELVEQVKTLLGV